ncbi:Uncharacterised protein [Mycobacterium tuberculosis]|nr:Uncharacterised protein [Mycobacterium tuberculosis]
MTVNIDELRVFALVADEQCRATGGNRLRCVGDIAFELGHPQVWHVACHRKSDVHSGDLAHRIGGLLE